MQDKGISFTLCDGSDKYCPEFSDNGYVTLNVYASVELKMSHFDPTHFDLRVSGLYLPSYPSTCQVDAPSNTKWISKGSTQPWSCMLSHISKVLIQIKCFKSTQIWLKISWVTICKRGLWTQKVTRIALCRLHTSAMTQQSPLIQSSVLQYQSWEAVSLLSN